MEPMPVIHRQLFINKLKLLKMKSMIYGSSVAALDGLLVYLNDANLFGKVLNWFSIHTSDWTKTAELTVVSGEIEYHISGTFCLAVGIIKVEADTLDTQYFVYSAFPVLTSTEWGIASRVSNDIDAFMEMRTHVETISDLVRIQEQSVIWFNQLLRTSFEGKDVKVFSRDFVLPSDKTITLSGYNKDEILVVNVYSVGYDSKTIVRIK